MNATRTRFARGVNARAKHGPAPWFQNDALQILESRMTAVRPVVNPVSARSLDHQAGFFQPGELALNGVKPCPGVVSQFLLVEGRIRTVKRVVRSRASVREANSPSHPPSPMDLVIRPIVLVVFLIASLGRARTGAPLTAHENSGNARVDCPQNPLGLMSQVLCSGTWRLTALQFV